MGRKNAKYNDTSDEIGLTAVTHTSITVVKKKERRAQVIEEFKMTIEDFAPLSDKSVAPVQSTLNYACAGEEGHKQYTEEEKIRMAEEEARLAKEREREKFIKGLIFPKYSIQFEKLCFEEWERDNRRKLAKLYLQDQSDPEVSYSRLAKRYYKLCLENPDKYCYN